MLRHVTGLKELTLDEILISTGVTPYYLTCKAGFDPMDLYTIAPQYFFDTEGMRGLSHTAKDDDPRLTGQYFLEKLIELWELSPSPAVYKQINEAFEGTDGYVGISQYPFARALGYLLASLNPEVYEILNILKRYNKKVYDDKFCVPNELDQAMTYIMNQLGILESHYWGFLNPLIAAVILNNEQYLEMICKTSVMMRQGRICYSDGIEGDSRLSGRISNKGQKEYREGHINNWFEFVDPLYSTEGKDIRKMYNYIPYYTAKRNFIVYTLQLLKMGTLGLSIGGIRWGGDHVKAAFKPSLYEEFDEKSRDRSMQNHRINSIVNIGHPEEFGYYPMNIVSIPAAVHFYITKNLGIYSDSKAWLQDHGWLD